MASQPDNTVPPVFGTLPFDTFKQMAFGLSLSRRPVPIMASLTLQDKHVKKQLERIAPAGRVPHCGARARLTVTWCTYYRRWAATRSIASAAISRRRPRQGGYCVRSSKSEENFPPGVRQRNGVVSKRAAGKRTHTHSIGQNGVQLQRRNQTTMTDCACAVRSRAAAPFHSQLTRAGSVHRIYCISINVFTLVE